MSSLLKGPAKLPALIWTALTMLISIQYKSGSGPLFCSFILVIP